MAEQRIRLGEIFNFSRGGIQIPKLIPKASPTLAIIPSNKKGTGFYRNMWSENKAYLKGLMSKDEFESVVDMSSKLVSKVYSHNRKKDIEGLSWALIIALFIATVLLLCYFFMVYYGVRDENQPLRIVGYICLGLSVGLTSVIGIINAWARPDKYKPFKDMVRKTLVTFFDRINGKMGVRGLEWYVPDNHFWIEVKISLKKAKEYKDSIGYDPRQDPDSEDEDIIAPVQTDNKI
mmetsp:Transcript_27639/g.26661  ORF Transcript_27639/g.26661 Transcript_27639/m.26661 type:complete len:234 (+) Transcript_27639:44-745(+)